MPKNVISISVYEKKLSLWDKLNEKKHNTSSKTKTNKLQHIKTFFFKVGAFPGISCPHENQQVVTVLSSDICNRTNIFN